MAKPARKERIDKLLVERGLADSRTKAQALVMAGVVLADERRIEMASELVRCNVAIRIKGQTGETKYASRAGLKLEHALARFGIDPAGWTCIDIGSSTGGFTDCLLQHGAKKVVAIDSGTNQMTWRLRTDQRVELHENTNARFLTPTEFEDEFDLAVVDVSFISVEKVLPSVVPLLKANSFVIVLIKPQFEVGRGEVGKGGIVRNEELQQRVIHSVNRFAGSLELRTLGVVDSPIRGNKGNREFLALYGLGSNE